MFENLIGNRHIKAILERVHKNGRVPRSLIFVGEDGIGKKEFALEIAKASVCRSPVGQDACDQCSACKRSKKFSLPTSGKKEDYLQVFFSEHPDIGIVVRNKQTIYIDAIRNLESEANFRPYEAKTRFFIIDDADKMTTQASNALLKTLEEPPETSYIFLITSNPAALLPTIRSRCQTISFAPVAKEKIEQFLFDQKEYSSKDAKLLANISQGSIGSALTLNLEDFRARRNLMFAALESLSVQGNLASLLQTAEEINSSKNRDEFETYLWTLQTLINDVWKLGIDKNSKVVNSDFENRLLSLKDAVSAKRLSAWVEEIETLRATLRFNVNRKVATDALFVKMAG